jgi:hypothetical protein
VIRVTLLRILGEVGGDGTGACRPALGLPMSNGPADKTSGCTNYCIVRGGRSDHGGDMVESTVSFPAVFFAAIIGVIIFIALSAVLLEPRE